MANCVFERLICGKYKICRLIGTGSFGSTYAGYDISSGEDVAIKLELRSSLYFHLENESKVYKRLGSKSAAIPQLRWSGTDGEYSVVVISLLGPSLESLFTGKGHTFTLPTVITIAEQLISCLEHIHGRHIIHRDLKPDNILIGRGLRNHHIHIIDFGLAKQYRDPQTHINIPYSEGYPLVGTTRFASINAHLAL